MFSHLSHERATQLLSSFGSPLYLYDKACIFSAINAYQHPKKPHIHYAVKANSNLSLLKIFKKQGFSFDIVSLGECLRVIEIGGSARDCVFSGSAKTQEELDFAIRQNIGQINIESHLELDLIIAIASHYQQKVNIALRINPDIDPKTHPYISTGLKANKFGIALDEILPLYQKAAASPYLDVHTISCHIGSQITQLSPFMQALDCLKDCVQKLALLGISITDVDIGGGLGVAYHGIDVPSPQDLLNALYTQLPEGITLHLQPGRSLIADSGILLCRVLQTKTQADKQFVFVDAGMNDYLRPALYHAYPQMINLSRPNADNAPLVDIVGPVCESADTFAYDTPLIAQAGDILAFLQVGAYGMSMSSQYNSRLRPAEVLLDGANAHLIRSRERYPSLWQDEIILPD